MTENNARKFQIIYKQETGEELTPEEAFEYAESLVEMVRLIYKPIKKEDFKKFDNVVKYRC